MYLFLKQNKQPKNLDVIQLQYMYIYLNFANAKS